MNILLDGAYVHGGCPNRMDPPSSYAPFHSYESITILKGSQTVLYGGGGSGGTVLMERATPAFSEGEVPRISVDAGYVGPTLAMVNSLLWPDVRLVTAQGRTLLSKRSALHSRRR